ncbi:FKBP-type peptidyl-prolyl cis-trans isomerase [Bythopirellula polymerisocia]|uniref:Peptidyl-prolyl cis-trans isomerase n=1 Tax=Bythopirellula polymerisocia TaxID=2528003 RepID=A0A5C6CXS2_9BACT|nr:FKBP-type peptidyl-prolyl cis-trans isomerase [Bythopirellula polymerisocia]TWU29340.1 FKBP-type 22 kDa peptidyl-prolyl cis-trans isomerase [Bythopirellula polymerisocia]
MIHSLTLRTIALATCLTAISCLNSTAEEGLPSGGQADNSAAPVYSYAIGLEIGTSFLADGVVLDIDSLVAGIKDGLAKAKPKYEEQKLVQSLRELSQARAGAMIDQNKKFLEENKKTEGIVTLPSGLQYKVLKSGAGATPTKDDTVRTHYEGKLVDGTVFDSSYERNEPAEFPVTGVIAGWTEALQLMKVGDKWQLFIPSDLAYGEAGAGGVIPPHATLIFDIELLDVVE